jgi:hypothetical protein
MIVSKITELWRRWRNATLNRSPQASSAELTGVPVRPRIKTYSAESGHVYQHAYRGTRSVNSVQEYVFSISTHPGHWDVLTVQLADFVIAEWERRNGRTLSSTQKYAIAKMALFQALDQTGLGPVPLRISPDFTAVKRYLEVLQIA